MPFFIYAYMVCSFVGGAAWASAAVSQGPLTYEVLVDAVGFNVRAIAQNAQNNGQVVNLGVGAGHAFMNAAYDFSSSAS